MERVGGLRRRAGRYRQLARLVLDPTTEKAIDDVADELELTAAKIEREHRIRERAHAISVAHGRPIGRDVEFWRAAEREIDLNRSG